MAKEAPAMDFPAHPDWLTPAAYAAHWQQHQHQPEHPIAPGTHNRVPFKIGHDFLFATFPESEAFPWFTAYFTFAGH